MSINFKVGPPTKLTAFAAGIIPYLTPNVPATGSKGTAPPMIVPSAPNFNLDFKVSRALSFPSKPSNSV